MCRTCTSHAAASMAAGQCRSIGDAQQPAHSAAPLRRPATSSGRQMHCASATRRCSGRARSCWTWWVGGWVGAATGWQKLDREHGSALRPAACLRTTCIAERPLHLAISQVATWPRENAASVRIPSDACNVFRDYCSRFMYQVGRGLAQQLGTTCWLALHRAWSAPPPAPLSTCFASHPRPVQSLLSAVKSSFAALRFRLASTAVGGVLFVERPLFSVELQLRLPAVVLGPSLEEIQEVINDTARKASGWGRGRRRRRCRQPFQAGAGVDAPGQAAAGACWGPSWRPAQRSP